MKMKKKLLAALLASALAAGMLPTSACAVSSAYTSSNATLISFTDSAVTADGKYSGYEIEGTDVSITAAGTYVFSGDCDDGSITVKKGVTGVTLVLNGLTLTNADSAAITLNKTAEAALIAAAGSENTVADTAGANDENAAVKVKSGASLSLSGTGTLTACGNVKNGIKGASDAVITVDEMTLNIEAADDGLSCDDELTIKGGRVNITAGGDAVKASPDTDDTENPDTTSLGSVTISGGTITLEAAEDGIQADGDLTISGGTFAVTANGGHTTAISDEDASCKGLKAGKTLTVSGGTFTVDSADDALHANDGTVSGGTLTLASGDDAVHVDNDLVVGVQGSSSTSTPKINITASYEGLEGTTVSVYSGDIDVVASDDGVNAASSELGEHSDKFAINIAGGDLYIDAGSDGLDSNNDISITGGRVEVYGADAMMDAAIDYDGTFTLSGGTLFGAGMEPTAGTQAYIAVGETSPSGGMGGGPGGMQAALLLKKRGYYPVIFESRDHLGGSAVLASKAPCKGMVAELIETMKAEMKEYHIEVRLNTPATVETLRALDPYGVVVACGGDQIVPNIPGVDRSNVYYIEDVLMGRVSFEGKNIAVIGGGHVGLEVAHFLCDNNKVTVVEMQKEVGVTIYRTARYKLLSLLAESGVEVLTEHAIAGVTDGAVELKKTDTGEVVTRPADIVIMALGNRPDKSYEQQLKDAFDKVVFVGDANKGGTMADATLSAYENCWFF